MDTNNKQRRHSIILAASTCVAEMLGGGIVSLPYILVQTYVVFGSLMIILGALLTGYTAWLLSELYLDIFSHIQIQNKIQIAIGIHEESKQSQSASHELRNSLLARQVSASTGSSTGPTGEQRTPYMAIGAYVLPNYGEYLLGFCVGITLLFVDIVFLVLCGMNLLTIIGSDRGVSQTISIIIFAVSTLTVSYLWNKVEHYQFFVWLAVLSSFVAIALAFPTVIVHSTKPMPAIPSIKSLTFFDFINGYGTIMFAFGGHAGFPTYQRNMGQKYQHLFKYSCFVAYLYLFIMIFPFSLVLALLYGSNVNENVLKNLPHGNSVAVIIIILVTFHMATAMSTLVPPVAGILSKLCRILFKLNPLSYKTYWWSPIVVQFIAAVIAIGLQDNFLVVMGILGNTTITMCTFVMPCILYLIHFKNRISMFSKVACVTGAVIGILTGICSIGVSIYSLI